MMTVKEAMDERNEVEHLLRMHRLLVHGLDAFPSESCQRCVGLGNRRIVLKSLTFAAVYSAGPNTMSALSAQEGR